MEKKKVITISRNSLIGHETNRILRIKDSHDLDRMTPFILPYLEEHSDKTYNFSEELYGLEEREMEGARKILLPNKIGGQWNSLDYSFVLYWGRKFSFVDNWEYLTYDILPNADEVYEKIHLAAIQNMESYDVRVKHFVLGDTIKVYMMQSSIDIIPPLTPGIMFTHHVWNELFHMIGKKYYILPMFSEAIFAIDIPDDFNLSDIWKYEDVFLRVLEMEYPFPTPFTRKIFFYENSKISIQK